jgi:hypothetical protein
MAFSADKLFAPFEGTREPLMPAIFRVAFFAGLTLHFAPSLLQFDESYSHGALRLHGWSHWLYVAFSRIPEGMLRAGAIIAVLGCVAATLGLCTRASVIVAGLGCYVYTSFNALPVQTLAIVSGWGILLVWMAWGGGAATLSLDAWLARRRGRQIAAEDRLFSSLALFQVLLGVWFAGVEKLLAGWPGTNEMHLLLSYPKGFLVRDWVVGIDWMHSEGFGRALSWLTLFVELGTPPLLLYRRTRLYALAVWEAFFFGIVAMLEVPPLFYCIFAFGALLALDEQDLARLTRRRSG